MCNCLSYQYQSRNTLRNFLLFLLFPVSVDLFHRLQKPDSGGRNKDGTGDIQPFGANSATGAEVGICDEVDNATQELQATCIPPKITQKMIIIFV